MSDEDQTVIEPDVASVDETEVPAGEVVDEGSEEPGDQRAPYVHDPEVHGRDYRVEGNDVRDYIGVDPEYRTYANPGDAPILTDTERFLYTSQYDHLEGNHEDDLAKEGVPADELEAGEPEAGETEGGTEAESVHAKASGGEESQLPFEP